MSGHFARRAPTSQHISSSSLRSHGNDQVGHDVCSPMHESGPVVSQESMVESSGTEPFGVRHYRFSSERQCGTVEFNLLEGKPFVSSTHCHCDNGCQDSRLVRSCPGVGISALLRPGGDVAPRQWVGAQCNLFDAWQSGGGFARSGDPDTVRQHYD